MKVGPWRLPRLSAAVSTAPTPEPGVHLSLCTGLSVVLRKVRGLHPCVVEPLDALDGEFNSFVSPSRHLHIRPPGLRHAYRA
jgi:hypothetical protein